MDPWPSDLILTCKLWVSQNKLSWTRAECEAAVRWPPQIMVSQKCTAGISKGSQLTHLLTSQTYIQHFVELLLDLSLLSTQKARANQCPWSEELTDEALSVASPTCNVLIAVINAPRQHLEAVWAINERVRQWCSVLLCGLQDYAWGAVNAFAERAEDSEHAPAIQTLLDVSDATARDAVSTGW